MGQKFALTSLGPFGLSPCGTTVTITVKKSDYVIQMSGLSDSYQGPISPPRPVVPNLLQSLNVQEQASHFVWAYPMEGAEKLTEMVGLTSGMTFATNGGFLFLNAKEEGYEVVSSYAINTTGSDLKFSGPIEFKDPVQLALLEEQKRLLPVTLKFLKDKQIQKFCWIHPGEKVDGNEVPNGAFLYQHKDNCFYFKLL
eukprot:TRINITY_DN25190_c0_g1_i1.p1 TRINITY_DN25190_c0_g1~~TRINITY_DN25190_c0_g1_i1.p1  ORF type:complete len:197 (-),score=51.01 TRINITY_DN25190_c0_g1_i1:45-635(-)